MARVRSMRGEIVDFNRMNTIESKVPALGNARMNAQGDILDEKGQVLRTQSQIEAEFRQRRQQAQQDATVDIKQVMNSDQLAAELSRQQGNSPPNAADIIQRPVRRKQVDSD